MASSTCAVCQTARKGMNRMGGLDVCDVCAGGGAEQAVEKRGWSLSSKQWVHRTKNATFYHCQTDGHLAIASPLAATFRMNRFPWSLLAIFFGITVDDPLFNKLVYATSSTKDATKRFLESDGAQSAVMDIVGELGTVKINGSLVSAHVMSTDGPPSESRIETEAAVLMAHVEAFAAVFG